MQRILLAEDIERTDLRLWHWKVSERRLLSLDASILGAAICQVHDSRNSREPRKAIRGCGVSQSCCGHSLIVYLRRVTIGPCLACIAHSHVVLRLRRRRLNSGE